MNQPPYGSSNPAFSDGRQFQQFVDPRRQPTSQSYHKYIRRLVDLGIADPGIEITTGQAFEVAIYADSQINIKLQPGNAIFTQVTELRLVGDIKALNIWSNTANQVGRVVVYAGAPFLGLNFQREDPRTKCPDPQENSFTWNSGSNVSPNFGTVALGSTLEAMYIKGIQLERVGGGTIDKIEFLESDTGALKTVLQVENQRSAGEGRVSYNFEYPYRIAANGSFVATGSNEAANKTCNFIIQSIFV